MARNRVLKLVLMGAVISITQSCGFMMRAVITPNTCKKCDILDGGSVVYTEDECGGGVYNMEMRMKARAYDMGPNCYVVCETYKLEQ